MRILRTALLTVAGGVLIAFVLYWFIPPSATMLCCGVGVSVTDPGYIDPWTGETRPMTVLWPTDTGPAVTKVWDLSQLAPPIPLRTGFAIGSVLTLTVITTVARRPRRPAPDSAVPAA